MLESVHGIADLLKSGWQPRRTIVFCSWDAEEDGMVGSTEWGEQHAQDLEHATAYFNMDVGVAGPTFGASAVPALKQFVRDVTKQVPSAKTGTVYDAWRDERERERVKNISPDLGGAQNRPPAAKIDNDVEVGDLGSGSDYSVFLQRLGIPATDIGSNGPYGVYHSAFDDFAWFKKFADPDFRYEQQMARVFGVEMLHMAAADYLPEDYELYGKEIVSYVQQAQAKAQQAFGAQSPSFADASGSRALPESRSADPSGTKCEDGRPCPFEPGAHGRRARTPHSARTAAPSMVSSCDLRSRRIHRLRCRRNSRSKRSSGQR
jgi:N-acetylated-alpha-linked acidic dipeptidase